MKNVAAPDGVGVVLLPTWMCGPELHAGQLEEVLSQYTLSEPSVHAIYPPGRHLSAKVRAFVDFLVERFRRQPWDDVPA
jgi:DNA-binding transcriptional LysR family regulator